jgi:Raf kinase inhibitor-like YbhB/YbcL family protein
MLLSLSLSLSLPPRISAQRFFRAASAMLTGMAVLPVLSLSSSLPPPQDRARTGGASAMTFALRSPDFANGANIPRTFTCEGEDRSPALEWSGAPPGTRAFALIADDPDAPAGTWVHWVIYNIPGETHALKGGMEKNEKLGDGSLQGRNDFRKSGYNGPCPPPGKAHRYFFKLYALSGELALAPGASKSDVEHAMEGHILARTEWIGRYQR